MTCVQPMSDMQMRIITAWAKAFQEITQPVPMRYTCELAEQIRQLTTKYLFAKWQCVRQKNNNNNNK